MKKLDQKIKEIMEADYQVHHIFRKIVDKKSIFTENENIIDLVFLKREYLNARDSDSAVDSTAKIIIATNEGIVFAEEGFEEISKNYLGYKLKHIYYDKISSFELDITLLKGKFKIYTVSSEVPEILIEFNAAEYYEQFERFVNSVRKKKIICNSN